MKKLAKVFGLLAVVICMGATLVACGGVTGTYKYSETVQGMSIEVSLKLESGDKFTMTYKMTMGEESESESVEGTYKVDGEKLTLTVEGQDMEGTIKNGSITIESPMGGEITLKK